MSRCSVGRGSVGARAGGAGRLLGLSLPGVASTTGQSRHRDNQCQRGCDISSESGLHGHLSVGAARQASSFACGSRGSFLFLFSFRFAALGVSGAVCAPDRRARMLFRRRRVNDFAVLSRAFGAGGRSFVPCRHGGAVRCRGANGRPRMPARSSGGGALAGRRGRGGAQQCTTELGGALLVAAATAGNGHGGQSYCYERLFHLQVSDPLPSGIFGTLPYTSLSETRARSESRGRSGSLPSTLRPPLPLGFSLNQSPGRLPSAASADPVDGARATAASHLKP